MLSKVRTANSVGSALALLLFFLAPSARAQSVKPEARLATGEHSASVNGVKFWYAVRGAGPLLIVQAPGWGIGSEYLQNGLAPLEAHFTLVFYDTRGSGRSSKPVAEKNMSTSDMVDDLEGLRQYWQSFSLFLRCRCLWSSRISDPLPA